MVNRVWTCHVLYQVRWKLEWKVLYCTQVDGKPLPWCKPSTSRYGATTKEKLELRPKPLCEYW